jgi:hypothetical protein
MTAVILAYNIAQTQHLETILVKAVLIIALQSLSNMLTTSQTYV